MKRVVIYIRFPFDNDGGLNIEQQLKDFATNKGWEVKDIMVEKNCVLKRTEKTQLNDLLNKSKKKEFDIVLVKGIYHITRDTLKYLEIEKELSDNGVIVYSQELDSEINIKESLNEKNVESLLSFLTDEITEDRARNERYLEMQLRLETLLKIRWAVGEAIVDIVDQEYLIQAYEILNEMEKLTWDYINGGK